MVGEQPRKRVHAGSRSGTAGDAKTLRVLAIGNTIIDTVLTMPRIPIDDKVWVESKQTYIGGQGANAAQDMALLGLDVTFVTRIGDDADGKRALEHFNSLGIDTSGVIVVPGAATTSACVTIATEDVTRSCLMYSDSKLFDADIKAAIGNVDVSSFDLVYTDGHQARDLAIPLAKAAATCGLRIVVDIEVVDEDTRALADIATHVIAPGKSVCILAGVDDVAAAVVALASGGNKTVVGTLGADGSYGARQDDSRAVYVPAIKCNVRDTVGAGDAYHAGYIAALAEESTKPSLQDAMELATKVGAANCETAGPVVSRKSLEAFGLLMH